MAHILDNITIEGDASIADLILPSTPIATTTNGTTNLDNTSHTAQLFTGSATGYSIVLPNSTTIPQGHKYELYNTGTQPMTVKYFGGATFFTLAQNSTAYVYLQDPTTPVNQGTWLAWQISTDPNIASGIVNYNLTSSVLFTTTSATDALITGFTVTPQAGTYAVWVNINASCTTGSAVTQAVVFKDGAQVSDTRRTARPGAATTAYFIALQGIIQFNGVQTIDVRVNTSAGTLSVTNRTLTLIRIGN